MKMFLLGVLVIFSIGCANVRTASHGPITTKFISSPSGARIEVNGSYIGNAPVDYTWPAQYQDGARFRDELTIKAFPSGPGQFAQRKFFESHGGNLPLIPAQIYFDMTAPMPVEKTED
jgi:hypothetical protein